MVFNQVNLTVKEPSRNEFWFLISCLQTIFLNQYNFNFKLSLTILKITCPLAYSKVSLI